MNAIFNVLPGTKGKAQLNRFSETVDVYLRKRVRKAGDKCS